MKLYNLFTGFLLSFRNYYLMRAARALLTVMGYWEKQRSDYENKSFFNEARATMKKRTDVILSCPDMNYFRFAKNAGKVVGDKQIMHNGLDIFLGSYYGHLNTELLERCKGVHEPQEEKAFDMVLKKLPENATMIELGAFWAFYSMWFCSENKMRKCYLVEPEPEALLSGKNNFRLNGLKGNFHLAYAGKKSGLTGLGEKIICVDDFMETNQLPFVDLLHSDIQGAELEMLAGAEKSISSGKINYIFISTHSNQLHADCVRFLESHRYKILCSANMDESFSWDGLIVAQLASRYNGLNIPISLRKI